MTDAKDQPLFDDTRKALEFALNATDVKMPQPAMTKAMAEGIVKARSKKLPKTKRAKAIWLNEMAAEMDREDAERRALVRAAFRRRSKLPTGLEQAAQAGFILAELAKLSPLHQTVLTGVLMRSHRPCNCRSPCCSGFALNMRWSLAVTEMCTMLKEGSHGPQKPGFKSRLSTLPSMRKAIVEGYFTKREITLTQLATAAECTMATAAKHRAWIVEGLEQAETEAWQEIAELLDKAGITGAFTD